MSVTDTIPMYQDSHYIASKIKMSEVTRRVWQLMPLRGSLFPVHTFASSHLWPN